VLAPFRALEIKEWTNFTGYAADCVRRHNRRGRRKGHDEINRRAQALNHEEQRIYEELFIVKPTRRMRRSTSFVEQLRTQLTAAGATVDKIDKWGKRRLAYRVDKYREGAYGAVPVHRRSRVVKDWSAAEGVGHRPEVFDGAHRQTLEGLEKRKRTADKRAARRAASARPHRCPAGAAAGPGLPVQHVVTEAPVVARLAKGELSHGEIKGRPAARPPPAPDRPGDKAVATQKKAYSGARRCAFLRREDRRHQLKDVKMLHAFVAERGRIVPRRISACRAPHQRRLATPSRRREHRAAAVRGAILRAGGNLAWKVILREDIEKLGSRARGSESR